MDILRKIMDERRADVQSACWNVPADLLREQASARQHHSIGERLNRAGACIISEIKKASPSAGLLREDYRPEEIAQGYERAGAAGISVLTEPRHFMGDESHLRAVRSAIDLPILRKDFMCDPYQVLEAAAWGADVVLIIVAALDRETIDRLYGEAMNCGLEVLAEAHTESEVDIALSLEQAIVGVNSRNLKTLKTDLATAKQLAPHIPENRLCVAESGIRERSDILELSELGYDGFLIGEALVREKDPAQKLRELSGV